MASLATPAGSGCLYWKLCRRWCSVFVVLFFLTDRPAKAKWLTDQERAWLENAMQDEERARAAKQSHSSAWRGLADIRVLALALVYFRYLSRAVYAWHLVPANHSQFRCFLAGDWFPERLSGGDRRHRQRSSGRVIPIEPKSAAGTSLAPACWRLPG